MIKNLFQSEFIKNTSTLISGTAIAQAIPILVSPVLSRLYSPDDFCDPIEWLRRASFAYDFHSNIASYAGRINIGHGRLNFQTEYALEDNDSNSTNNFISLRKSGERIIVSRRCLSVYARVNRLICYYYQFLLSFKTKEKNEIFI